VVVDVVVDAVVEVGCGRVVVVVLVGAVTRGRVATVVVATHGRLCGRADAYRRRAEAIGTETASTTVIAVMTTSMVRNLRLILFPFFDGWVSAASEPRHSAYERGRAGLPLRRIRRCRRRPALGSNHPRGGARTCSITA
jgi:hypothetical protein